MLQASKSSGRRKVPWMLRWVNEGSGGAQQNYTYLLRVGVKLQEKSLSAAQRLQETLDAAGKRPDVAPDAG